MNATETNWGSEPWREPALAEGDTLVRSECGRIAFSIDYRSHWFVLVKDTHACHALLVKHGGGEERILLPRCNNKVLASIVSSLGSDEAYLLMHQLYDIHKQAKRDAEDETGLTYRKAFAEGRLKKRNLPKRGICKVWIVAECMAQHVLECGVCASEFRDEFRAAAD